MDRLRIARSIRTLRVRRAWTQRHLAAVSNVSRTFVSDVERGLVRYADIGRLEAVVAALGADLDVRVRWRGEALDRLLDEAHADLVDLAVRLLKAAGWEAALDVTFNEYADRGSVDVLGRHPLTRSLLVVEAKSVIGDAQATLMPLDRKVRLGSVIARPLGWAPATTSRLLVMWGGTANRRRVARIAASFDAALPARGAEVRRWLREPVGTLSGLLFLSDSAAGGVRRRATGRMRVNPPRRRPGVAG